MIPLLVALIAHQDFGDFAKPGDRAHMSFAKVSAELKKEHDAANLRALRGLKSVRLSFVTFGKLQDAPLMEIVSSKLKQAGIPFAAKSWFSESDAGSAPFLKIRVDVVKGIFTDSETYKIEAELLDSVVIPRSGTRVVAPVWTAQSFGLSNALTIDSETEAPSKIEGLMNTFLLDYMQANKKQ